jgi:hypothetical protein
MAQDTFPSHQLTSGLLRSLVRGEMKLVKMYHER